MYLGKDVILMMILKQIFTDRPLCIVCNLSVFIFGGDNMGSFCLNVTFTVTFCRTEQALAALAEPFQAHLVSPSNAPLQT